MKSFMENNRNVLKMCQVSDQSFKSCPFISHCYFLNWKMKHKKLKIHLYKPNPNQLKSD